MAKILTPDTLEEMLAPISELKHITTLFKGLPEHASRPVDMETVLKYAQEDLEKFPALRVVDTDEGLGVIDGNHRWNAFIARAKLQALGLYDADFATQKEALKHALSPEAQEAFSKAFNSLEVKIKAEDYKTVENVAKACLTANLENGLPPANKARVVMALEYWLIVRSEENPPSQASIARKFGITPPTLNEYVKNHDRSQEAQAEAEGEEGAEMEAEAQAEKTQEEARAKVLKKVDAFKKYMKTVYDNESQDLYLEAMAEVFSMGFSAEWLRQDTMKPSEEAVHLQKVMEISSLDGSSLGHVKKFHSALTILLQKNEDAKTKKAPASSDKKAPASKATAKKAPASKKTQEAQEDKSEGLFTGPHGEQDHNYMDNFLS